MIRITLTDLHVLYGNLQAFCETFARKSAEVNNNVAVPLQIEGIAELPPCIVQVVTAGAQVGLQGATYVLSKMINIKRLGATANADTFSWVPEDKVYVCNMPFTAARVYELLTEAKQQHFEHRDIQIVLAAATAAV